MIYELLLIHSNSFSQLLFFQCSRVGTRFLSFHLTSNWVLLISSKRGRKKCKAMHLQHFAAEEGKPLEASRVFHFTYFTLEQLHSEARLGCFFFFSPGGVVHTRAEGEQKKVILQQRSITRWREQISFLPFIFFGHWEFSYVWVCF
jgi:hypothetical protein